jgi:hypothetical protein
MMIENNSFKRDFHVGNRTIYDDFTCTERMIRIEGFDSHIYYG